MARRYELLRPLNNVLMIKFLLSFVLGIISAFLYESLARYIGVNMFKRDALIVSGYKLHHSLYGLLFLAFAYVNKSIFLAGFGLGVIAQHTLTDGFRFIQKV